MRQLDGIDTGPIKGKVPLIATAQDGRKVLPLRETQRDRGATDNERQREKERERR